MVINLTALQLLLAFIMPLGVIYLSHRNSLAMEKDIFNSGLKMIIQLLFIGYILTFILLQTNSSLGSIYIFVMLFFGIRKLKSRVKGVNSIYLKNGSIAIIIGSIITLLYFILIIVNPSPKFDPQYVIPLYGMILGNTLTAVVLAVNELVKQLNSEQVYINTLIALGVNPRQALTKIFSRVLTVAITPTLTSMSAMGLVSLPGMMTGQILSGTEPLIAIKYQIAIMFAILASASLATMILIFLTRNDIINEKNQLEIKY